MSFLGSNSEENRCGILYCDKIDVTFTTVNSQCHSHVVQPSPPFTTQTETPYSFNKKLTIPPLPSLMATNILLLCL